MQQRSTKSGVSSVKSQKSKSTKSAKTQQTSAKTTAAAAAFDHGGAHEVKDRRVVVYEGRHSAEVKLKKNALYDILGIEPTATQDEIKKAWRRKALQLHPDKNYGGNKEELNAKLAQAKRAYEILSDPTKKKIYDHYGIDAVQTFEETECGPKWLWFMYSKLGRVVSCIAFIATCFCCCFCFCLCCFNCCCNCCCNHCCKGNIHDDDDGYMEYDPEAARQEQAPPPPKSKLASIINSISSKRILKKKKKNNRTEEDGGSGAEAGGENIVLNEMHATSIRVEQPQTSGAAGTTTNSRIYRSQRSASSQQHPPHQQVFTRSTQEVTNEEKY